MLVIAAVGFYEHRKKVFIHCTLRAPRSDHSENLIGRRTCGFLPTCSDSVQINKQSSHYKTKLTVYEIVYDVRQSTQLKCIKAYL